MDSFSFFILELEGEFRHELALLVFIKRVIMVIEKLPLEAGNLIICQMDLRLRFIGITFRNHGENGHEFGIFQGIEIFAAQCLAEFWRRRVTADGQTGK